MNDFFVGYLPVPPGIALFLRKVIPVLALLAVVVALLLVRGQGRYDQSSFEFGTLRTFEGVVTVQPYPALLVARPGDTGQVEPYSRYLLVGAGKRGADDLIAGFAGKMVKLRGQLIYRAGLTMVEVEPGSVTAAEGPAKGLPGTKRDVGIVTVTGEIVDSKCYLGVMNPGRGKVHRDCASRCLSGGVPPIFITSDGRNQFLLAGTDGGRLRYEILRDFVAEPITVTGRLVQRGEERILMISPDTLRHPDSGLQARR